MTTEEKKYPFVFFAWGEQMDKVRYMTMREAQARAFQLAQEYQMPVTAKYNTPLGGYDLMGYFSDDGETFINASGMRCRRYPATGAITTY
jgi:hypothetical protein